MRGPTPGPWTANLDSDHGDYTVWGPQAEFIANIGTDPAANRIVAFDLAAANARLTSAAPDLRAALDHPALLELLGAIEDSGSPEAARLFALVQAWDSAREAAIAKAEGGA